MAVVRFTVPRDIRWTAGDRLRLWLGSEGAASLAESSPAGGRVIAEALPWAGNNDRGGLGLDQLGAAPLGFTSIGPGLGEGELGFSALGVNESPRVQGSVAINLVDKLAILPVGVDVIDVAGNATTKQEWVIQAKDAPSGVRNVTVAAGGSAGTALVSWTASADVV